MEITSRINRLAAFARTGGEQGASASDDFASQVQGSSDNTATQDRHQQLLAYSYRRKMPLMATGLMPEKSQAEFQAVGLAEEWQRVKADWQAKVAGMDEVSRAAAGVSLPDEEGDAATVSAVRVTSAAVSASPVASTSSAVAASPVENEPPAASASTAVQASASAEADSEPTSATQDRHQQLLVYSYRRKMPLMATGLMPEKSQAEFQAVGLAEEWQRVKADWQAKVAGMDEVSRAAAGVSLPDEEGDAASVSAGSAASTAAAASPVASTSSAVAASPVEDEPPAASASTAVQASASAESDSEPAAATQDRHQQLLVYSYRRKMPLMATGLMPEKSQAEFQAVGLAEEWQRVKADWQAKVAGMDEVSRAAAGVSLPDEE